MYTKGFPNNDIIPLNTCSDVILFKITSIIYYFKYLFIFLHW